MFDIRNYKSNKTEEQEEKKEFWTIKFLKEVDSNFPNINNECEQLVNGLNPDTEDAFNNKIDNWQKLVQVLQKLCRLYRIYDAQCLSKEN